MELFHLAEGRPANTDRGETAPAKRRGRGGGGRAQGGEPHDGARAGRPRLARKSDCGLGGGAVFNYGTRKSDNRPNSNCTVIRPGAHRLRRHRISVEHPCFRSLYSLCVRPRRFSKVIVLQMTERTWKNTEWPELTLASPENDDAHQVDAVPLGNVFDTICLVEIEFPNEHAKQVARFCDVLQRVCRGVPTHDRARMTLYDRARRNLAIFAGRQVTGGYLWTRR